MSQNPTRVKEPYFTKLNLVNPKFLEILNKTAELGLFTDESESILKYESTDYNYEREYYCSEEYFKNLKKENYTKYKKNGFVDSTPGGRFFIEQCEKLFNLSLGDGSQQGPGFRSSVYSPDGYLGWHKDEGYGVYVLMFTYCMDNPNGFYRWEDALTNKIHTLKDIPGWSAKSVVSLNELDSEWHCVMSTTPKCSLALTFENYNIFLNIKNFVQSDKYNYYETI